MFEIEERYGAKCLAHAVAVFPDLPAGVLQDFLWNETAFPFDEPHLIKKQLLKLRELIVNTKKQKDALALVGRLEAGKPYGSDFVEVIGAAKTLVEIIDWLLTHSCPFTKEGAPCGHCEHCQVIHELLDARIIDEVKRKL